MRYLYTVYGKSNKQETVAFASAGSKPMPFVLVGQAKGQNLQIILAENDIR
jgi:hypothetical protein